MTWLRATLVTGLLLSLFRPLDPLAAWCTNGPVTFDIDSVGDLDRLTPSDLEPVSVAEVSAD